MKSSGFAIVVIGLLAATLLGVVVGGGNVAVALTPAILFAAAYAVGTLPLRYPLYILTFCALTLENPADSPAEGLWKSPLYDLGAVLLAHLNVTFTNEKWLAFSGLDIVLVVLLTVAFHRYLTGSKIDTTGRTEDAPPMAQAVGVSFAGAMVMWLFGMARGGADVGSSLWQVERVVYLPIVFLLFRIAVRGASDRAAFAKVIIAAACLKAIVAIYVHMTVAPPKDEAVLAYATIHADSMLFALAFALLCAMLFEHTTTLLKAVPLLVLLGWGMVANHRRVVWVEVGAALLTMYALTPRTATKRAISRFAILASPVTLLYLVAGWGSSSAIFGPVATIRSVVDSNADGSTAWRDWENYDLFYTIRQSPLFGSGYGHGYIEIVKLPDISGSYSLYRFLPHNSILGLLAYGGYLGFAALFTMIGVGVFFAARAYRYADAAENRVSALAALAAILVYLVHCYGDMGLGTWTSVFTVAPAFAIASKLAVVTGAWPSKRRAPSAAQVPTGPRVTVVSEPTGSYPALEAGGPS